MSAPTNIIDNTPFKKPTPGDEEAAKRAKLAASPVEQASSPIPGEPLEKGQLRIAQFADGIFLKWMPNPKKPGTYVLYDGSGTPWLVTLFPAIADLVCQSVNLFFFMQRAERERAEKAKAAEALTDAIMADENRTLVDAELAAGKNENTTPNGQA